MQASKAPPSVDLLNLITGHWRAQAVYTAAKLGIADLLKSGPKSPAEIGAATNSHRDSIYRLLRALAAMGIFAEGGDGRFELTPTAELLRVDAPGSMRSLVLAICGVPWSAWNDTLYSVQTGKPAFDRVYGMSFFEYLAQDEEASRTFDDCMTAQSRMAHSAVASSYDFSKFRRIVDVGGGQGWLLELILRTNRGARGILFDQPHVIESARERLRDTDIEARCDLVEGDFFASVPEGGDAYLLATVIHDWDDEKALAILKNCHRAMTPGTRLLLSEHVIPQGNDAFFGKLLDLDMLVNVGGKERTADEYRSLLQRAGFEGMRILPTYGAASALSIVESIRP